MGFLVGVCVCSMPFEEGEKHSIMWNFRENLMGVGREEVSRQSGREWPGGFLLNGQQF